MALRNYSANAVGTTITAGIDNVTTTIPVAATTGFPATPFIAIIEPDTNKEEVVLVTNVAGLNLTVTRGYDGTTAQSHVTSSVFQHSFSAIDFREPNTFLNSGGTIGGNVTISGTLNPTNVADTATAASHYWVETGSDGLIRPKTLANVRAEIVTTTTVNSAAATTVGTVTSGTWNAGAVTTSGDVNSSTATGTINFAAAKTTGTVTLGSGITSGIIQIGGTAVGSAGTLNVLTGATTSGTKAINIGTNGSTGSTTTIAIGTTGGTTPTITLNAGVLTLNAATIDLSAVAETATAASHYFVEIASDGDIRPKTLANVKTEIVTTAAVNAAAATTVGTVTSGTWNASVVAGQYGGTGVANTGKTITVSGNVTIGSGTDTVTFATSGATSVTLPTSGTLVNSAVTSLSSLATVGTITSGTWSATLGADLSHNRPSMTSPYEITNVAAVAAGTTVNLETDTAAVWYYTTSASANFTLNFRAASGTTLSSRLAVGESISVVFLNTNGATPYYANAFQVDGSAVTPKWQYGSAPTAGNANSVDAYTFTIIKTAATPTYLVLAAMAKFA